MKYIEQTYEQMLQKSYGFDMIVQSVSPEWNKARILYQYNYINNNSIEQRIPKKIHQVWLGSAQIPKVYYKYMESWKQFHPDWEYKLWTDKDVKDVEITKRELFDTSINMGMKSDILRYEILRQVGGIYVDTDFECLKPFDDLLYLDFFTGMAYDVKFILYNGLIASIPNHPVMNKTVEIDGLYNGNKGSAIISTTGAYHFTRAFNSTVSIDTEGVVAFPMSFFYPFPNNVRKTVVAYSYIQECSYAIHHWGVSWVKSRKL
jgi:mannosyltransferase OCH1-like enzyme